jgi:hypothetical protein
VFLSRAQAPVALFGPGVTAVPLTLALTDAERAQLDQALKVQTDRVAYEADWIFTGDCTAGGLVFYLDQKGENLPISFAVGVKVFGRTATLQDLQVMVYREPYGKEVGERRFSRQFAGKTSADPLTLGKDIEAISGATISSASAARVAKKALLLAQILVQRGPPASKACRPVSSP